MQVFDIWVWKSDMSKVLFSWDIQVNVCDMMLLLCNMIRQLYKESWYFSCLNISSQYLLLCLLKQILGKVYVTLSPFPYNPWFLQHLVDLDQTSDFMERGKLLAQLWRNHDSKKNAATLTIKNRREYTVKAEILVGWNFGVFNFSVVEISAFWQFPSTFLLKK